ncbi:MAG: tRNA (guanosine(46)-N7)-methyltransferase TrmB [Chitinophagales bacterium]
MGNKGKQQKFDELNTFQNVFQNFDFKKANLIGHDRSEVKLAGKWNKIYFKNPNPIVLELACGKGEYSLGLSEQFPNKNFIGVDLKGNRIWKGAKKGLKEKRQNVAFIRSKIELLPHYFESGEVDEIWIIFPDPYPRKSNRNRRLTSPVFLDIYKKVLKKGGTVNLKTDDTALFDYSCEIAEEIGMEILEKDFDIYAGNRNTEGALAIKTFYEKIHLEAGKKIKYLKFVLH